MDGLLAADPDGGLLLAAVEELATADGGTALALLLASLAGAVTQLPGDGGRWALVPGPSIAVDHGTLSGRIGCALGAWAADGLVLLAGDSMRPRAFLLPRGTAGLTVEPLAPGAPVSSQSRLEASTERAVRGPASTMVGVLVLSSKRAMAR